MHRRSMIAGVNAARGSMAIVVYPFEFTSWTSTAKQVSFFSYCLCVPGNRISNLRLCYSLYVMAPGWSDIATRGIVFVV